MTNWCKEDDIWMPPCIDGEPACDCTKQIIPIYEEVLNILIEIERQQLLQKESICN